MATIAIHVVPRARATGVVGRHGDAIKVRVAAPPVDGAANAELVRFLAGLLGVPTKAVSIATGVAGRRKTVTIAGLTSERVRRRLLESGT